jgi:hypothetical protein
VKTSNLTTHRLSKCARKLEDVTLAVDLPFLNQLSYWLIIVTAIILRVP